MDKRAFNNSTHTRMHTNTHSHLLWSSPQPAAKHCPFKSQKLPQKKKIKSGPGSVLPPFLFHFLSLLLSLSQGLVVDILSLPQ